MYNAHHKLGQKLPSDWEAKVAKFHLYLRENLFGVDSCHFGNMDEVPVSFDLSNVYRACSFFTNLDLFCIDNARYLSKNTVIELN